MLTVSILLFFAVLGAVVFAASRRITAEMSRSAIDNLSESLDMIQGTVETILQMEAEHQKLMAGELIGSGDPEAYILNYERNKIMIRISLIRTGETEGISSTGETFTEEGLDFSSEKTVKDLPISQAYLNSMGTWAYTMKCPVMDGGREIGTFYIEYVYDFFDEVLPDNFYNANATLYIMDTASQRFVLKPKGMGERDAGHLNLEDFCRANQIVEENVLSMLEKNLEDRSNVMFYHKVQNKDSLIYLWALEDGISYLAGYVPVQAIQKESSALNQNIFIVVAVMLLTFFLCCMLFYFNERQKRKIRREQAAEREIHNRQLSEALREAQIANRSKTTFLSNMSHDIRTPMNAILGFTELLEKNANDSGKVREYTKKIMVSGRHLLSLINDVLDVSKIESGKVALSLGEFTLGNMIASVDAIIRPAARARNQSFEVTVTGIKYEHLIGDETRINQILINLLSNAVKYTAEGGSIWFRMIGLESSGEQRQRIRIEVEDNGYGMSAEYLEVIFDAFTRAENSTTNKVQGTGLGMAITKNIVELMGGTIKVESQVDRGSLFTVELELQAVKQEKEESFFRDQGIFRMLVADGREEICQDIRMRMEAFGVQSDTVCSGKEQVRRMCEQKETGYDLILLDREAAQELPHMDGVRPVCLLMLPDAEETEEHVLPAGIDGVLTGPFFVASLKDKLLEVCAAEDADRKSEEKRKKESALEGRHFLVAEDNEINGEILLELLEIEGATCEILVNGKLAAERFIASEPGSFDAVLMDVQMPVMNGYEATKMIRSSCHEEAADIPIIAMTANAFAEDVKDAMDAGMNAHIAKPIDMDALRETLNQLLKERCGEK